jgi:tetratricopeptide (TPR) repeat protein
VRRRAPAESSTEALTEALAEAVAETVEVEAEEESDDAEDDVAAVELAVDEDEDDIAIEAAPEEDSPPQDRSSDQFATGKVPAIEMEIEEESEESPESDSLLTIEEEPSPSATSALDEEPLIGSEEQESTDRSSRIQELQAAEGDGEEEDEEFISEHFTEAEVFIKYGLLEKAKGQLQLILERYPRHSESHAKLKEIYVSEGDRDKAVDACLALAELEKGRGEDEKGRELINEAIRIDPGNARAVDYAATLGGDAQAAAPPADPEPEDAGLSLEELEPQDESPLPDDLPPEAPISEAAPAIEIEDVVPDDVLDIESETPDDPLDIPAGGDGGEMPLDLEAVGETEAPVRSASRGSNPDAEKLGEVDFYIDQGLLEEARQVIQQLQKQYPGSPELEQRLQRLDEPAGIEMPEPREEAPAREDPSGLDLEVERALGGRRPSAPVVESPPQPDTADSPAATSAAIDAAPEAPSKPKSRRAAPVFRMEAQQESTDGDFFDLASELDKSLEEAQAEADSRDKDSLDGAGHSFEDIFQAFKRGVEQQVDSEDFDTHYNLGIAYREMGLVDEAIGEFQFAVKDPTRIVECCGILGLCFRDKGMPDLALQWYRRGLDMPDLGEQMSKGLRYDIAEVYREKGDYRAALDTYTEVYGVDSNYRDVAARIKEMREQLN